MEMFGASEKILPDAAAYYTVIFSGIVFSNTAFVLNAVMRSEGSVKMAMFSMLVGAIANIILDPLFIGPLGMGIAGAAVATIISQAISMIFGFWYFMSGKSVLKIKLYVPSIKLMLATLKLGTAAFLTQLGGSCVNLFFVKSAKFYGDITQGITGDAAIAGIGIITGAGTLFLMPVYGINQGVQPLIGYNFGAKKNDRVRELLLKAILIATAVTALGGLIIEIFPEFIIRMFNNDDAALLKFASAGLRKFYMLMPAVGFQIVSSNYFQAVGNPVKSALLSVSRQILFLIPFLIMLPLAMGMNGIFYATPAADFLSSLLVALFITMELRKLKVQQV